MRTSEDMGIRINDEVTFRNRHTGRTHTGVVVSLVSGTGTREDFLVGLRVHGWEYANGENPTLIHTRMIVKG